MGIYTICNYAPVCVDCKNPTYPELSPKLNLQARGGPGAEPVEVREVREKPYMVRIQDSVGSDAAGLSGIGCSWIFPWKMVKSAIDEMGHGFHSKL